MGLKSNSVFIGIISGLGLMMFYFLTMRILSGSWDAAFSQYEKLWYFMIPLSTGFGIQTGLFTYIRMVSKKSPVKMMATNTTASAVGMIACCTHHLSDLLPIIGLSAISAFIIRYQVPFLMVGIVSNAVGIIFLIKEISSFKS